MKKRLALLGLSALLLISALGQTTTYDAWFTWDKNTGVEMVTGYRLEYQKAPVVTNWTFLAFINGTTNVTVVKSLQGGYVYKFRLFAVNGIGVGTNLSNIIQIPTNAPSAVTNFSTTTPK